MGSVSRGDDFAEILGMVMSSWDELAGRDVEAHHLLRRPSPIYRHLTLVRETRQESKTTSKSPHTTKKHRPKAGALLLEPEDGVTAGCRLNRVRHPHRLHHLRHRHFR